MLEIANDKVKGTEICYLRLPEGMWCTFDVVAFTVILGLFWFTFLKMDFTSKTAGRKAKITKIWDYEKASNSLGIPFTFW